MKQKTKILVSVLIFPLSALAILDILSGGEPLVDESIILSLDITWLAYLIKPFRPPGFILAFLAFLIGLVIHNVGSHLLGFEEPVFFLFSLGALTTTFGLLIVHLLGKFKKLLVSH
ncbi:hypothetical protein KKD62_01925 [Patescibacteria group bacterium]|nr:hypothetical protein [Patescibacteria group bacterium]MBU1931239.1 hypothetical protein [Patescibacteria group bacterium]